MIELHYNACLVHALREIIVHSETLPYHKLIAGNAIWPGGLSISARNTWRIKGHNKLMQLSCAMPLNEFDLKSYEIQIIPDKGIIDSITAYNRTQKLEYESRHVIYANVAFWQV